MTEPPQPPPWTAPGQPAGGPPPDYPPPAQPPPGAQPPWAAQPPPGAQPPWAAQPPWTAQRPPGAQPPWAGPPAGAGSWPPRPYPPGPPGRPEAPIGQARLARIDPVPGTAFGLGYPAVHPTLSGLGVGATVAGIGSALVSFVVVCLGAAGSSDGWGPLVSGAFAILAALIGSAAIALGLVSRRQIGSAAGQLHGGGFAIAGIWCGIGGLGLTVFGFVLALLLV